MYKLFPESDSKNVCILISGLGGAEASAIVTNVIPNLNCQHSGGQSFPLHIFNEEEEDEKELLFGAESHRGWKLNISDYALEQFTTAYKDKKISGEDIFYYVYGILHSQEYKSRFATSLSKMLPRIPYAEDFWAFSKAGRKLSDIHLNYETAKPYSVKEQRDELVLDDSKLFLVEKMRFGKNGKEVDKTKIQYNSHISITGIPPEAYDYVVNGRPAIEWIMERYQLSKDKDSGILNNPNDWAKEHDNPRYILDLLKRIITVSMETMKIVNALPPLNEKNKA